ncbi:MAG TPA: UDP-N-acetylglucosamine 2-epimerase (non-hydrolyzing) [Anaerolineae bacterium]|nr:UDP-N-acetylglucosamine 2-epimerase (non-hydrolyzing) [Anaerolineae bacterium]
MNKKTVLVTFGTRPEVIKLAPVVMELLRRNQVFNTIVCATAQHRQMLDQALHTFEFPVQYDLDLMKDNQSLVDLTTRAMSGLDKVIEKVKPDVLLIQGDTTTAMCGALAGFYRRIMIGHVEAGLRTDNKFSPYPEEINRRIIGQLADFHFAPTERAKKALERENVTGKIFVTGNTVIDALLWVKDRVTKFPPEIPIDLNMGFAGKTIVLVTGHRRESFGEGFENICHAIREVAEHYPEVVFIYPVHMNPNVRKPVTNILGDHPRIVLLEPLGYEQFVWLMNRSDIVLTDSGGIQEEAPSLGKPVLVMRETTERPEGIEQGNAKLVGVKKENIVNNLMMLLDNPELRMKMGKKRNPYGDGKASLRIVDILESEIVTSQTEN